MCARGELRSPATTRARLSRKDVGKSTIPRILDRVALRPGPGFPQHRFGPISHGLTHCRYRGAEGMKRWVGLGVIADNLINIRNALAVARVKPGGESAARP